MDLRRLFYDVVRLVLILVKIFVCLVGLFLVIIWNEINDNGINLIVELNVDGDYIFVLIV